MIVLSTVGLALLTYVGNEVISYVWNSVTSASETHNTYITYNSDPVRTRQAVCSAELKYHTYLSVSLLVSYWLCCRKTREQ